VLLALVASFLKQLDDRQKIRWDEYFIDGNFAPAKKGRQSRQNQARQGYQADGPGRWREYSAGSIPGRDGAGGGHAPRANAREQPIRGKLIGDRRYDSNAVRRFPKRRHIQPIIPARSNNTQATDQDGRCLRR